MVKLCVSTQWKLIMRTNQCNYTQHDEPHNKLSRRKHRQEKNIVVTKFASSIYTKICMLLEARIELPWLMTELLLLISFSWFAWQLQGRGRL